MKKIFLIFFAFSTFFLLSVRSGYTEGFCAEAFASICNLGTGDAGHIVRDSASVLLILAIVLALLYLIYGGIKWITSGGDKGKVDAARSHITAAILGLVIALLAYFIVGLVLGFFKLGFSDLKIPTLSTP